MPVEVLIEGGAWDRLDVDDLTTRAASAALIHLGHAPDCFEISVLACDDARIAALNAQFRGKPTPTNVLSWPVWDLSADGDGELPEPPETGTADDPESLGDIALAWETCTREAVEQGKPLDAHLIHLTVHAVLHLLGYDHERDKDAALMEKTEIEILGKMGIADPYATML